MGGLVLKLRPFERVLINGVLVENGDRKSSMTIKTENTNVLRLRDAIHPDDANTPVKRLVYTAQLVVAGEASPELGKKELRGGLQALMNVFESSDKATEMLQDIMMYLEAGDFYRTMRALRNLIAMETVLFEYANISVPYIEPPQGSNMMRNQHEPSQRTVAAK
jgi:flagellar protein FlbT